MPTEPKITVAERQPRRPSGQQPEAVVVAARRTPLRVSTVIRFIVLALGCLGLLYPIAWMVSSSFKPDGDIFRDIGLVPAEPILDNFRLGWSGIPGHTFARFYLNTFVICLGATLGNLVSCSLAAYAFARLRFPLRGLMFGAMLMTVMIPAQVLLIPQYVIYFKLGWIDTFLPLIVPHWLSVDAFYVFLLTQFIRSLPTDMDNAARIDGCGEFGVFWRIVLPLASPALVTTAFFSFAASYDNFFGALIFLNSTKNYTVPLALTTFLDSSGVPNWGQMFAMSTISLVPMIIAFALMQRRLVEGVATTGLTS